MPQSADASLWQIERRAPSACVDLRWELCGRHNAANAVAAFAAAAELGVPPERAAVALHRFRGVKRRLEVIGRVAGVTVYDDFAHHPTAIAATLEGLRAALGDGRIIAVIEPRSNTMRMGKHRERLADCTRAADRVYWYQPPNVAWDMGEVAGRSVVPAQVCGTTADLIRQLVEERRPGDRIVIMSNGGFEGIHRRLLAALAAAG
jgi:UDP-N-acetylmuramate: L-alanyl-gamma-D-glutamyl-meso-diaminopimelate ligase